MSLEVHLNQDLLDTKQETDTCISVSFNSLFVLYDDIHNLVKLIRVINVDRRLITKEWFNYIIR